MSTGNMTGATPVLPVQAAARASLAGNIALQFTDPADTPTNAPVGTAFPLQQTVLASTAATVAPAAAANSSGATLVFRGTQNVNGGAAPVYELKVPGLGIDVNLPADGTAIATSSGLSVSGEVLDTGYAAPFVWTATQSGGINYSGLGVTGYQTPVSAVPISGQGTYQAGSTITPHGEVFGLIWLISNGAMVQAVTLGSTANITVNFANSAVNGTLSSMTAGATGFQSQRWNDVSLAGTLSGASVSGTTATPSMPAGALSFDASSTGTFDGALFGPNGKQLGIVWSLHDPTGQGKTAAGIVSAIRQN
jgi:hypothetical protein